MQGNRKTNTRPEVEVRCRLHHAGLRYRKNARLKLQALTVVPDIVFRRERVAVFVDGCFWHGCDEHYRPPASNGTYWESKIARNRARDTRVNAALLSDGWAVIRVWEHVPPDKAAELIRGMVLERRTSGQGGDK